MDKVIPLHREAAESAPTPPSDPDEPTARYWARMQALREELSDLRGAG